MRATALRGHVVRHADPKIIIISGSGASAVAGHFDDPDQGESLVIDSSGSADYFANVTSGPPSVVLSEFTPVPEQGPG